MVQQGTICVSKWSQKAAILQLSTVMSRSARRRRRGVVDAAEHGEVRQHICGKAEMDTKPLQWIAAVARFLLHEQIAMLVTMLLPQWQSDAMTGQEL